jgi:hypothetical protein
MKKSILPSVTLIFITSCSTYDYQRVNGETVNSAACSNPEYISTIAKSAVISEITKERLMGNGKTAMVAEEYAKKYDPESLTLYNLLRDARAAHGNDVTIQNVRYDVRNGKKRISVIYDVVKCK